ncbi:Nucleolar complex protein 3 [Borealophlyctis nickersoniae]|nr:Nucleolar complex protein 3 [Borealophlyctis nickersoniae]
MRKKSNWRKPKSNKVPVHEVEQEVFLSDEDMDLLAEYGSMSSFLTNLDPEALTKNEILEGPRAIMRAKGSLNVATDSEDEDDDDEEASFERKPRALKPEWTEKEKPARLPVRGEDGKLRQQEDVAESAKKVEVVKVVEMEEGDGETIVEAPVKSKSDIPSKKKEAPNKPVAAPSEEATLSRRERLSQAQERLAEVASAIIEDPENNIGKLKTLREIGQDTDTRIQRLALLTQLAVYKDIIPGYRIRALTDEEKAVKLSKDVKKLREYEQALLANYQNYLQVLENTIRSTSTNPTPKTNPLLLASMQCMTSLLTSVTHFNFRINIMTAVVSRMSLKNPPEIPILCCNAICAVFDSDESGEASLEAIKLISKAIKNKNYNVSEEVLKTFLCLRLKDELVVDRGDGVATVAAGTKRKKKDDKHVSRKMRKVAKKDKEVEKELKEAEAVYDRNDVQKRHTETLKFVFLTYFRILKNAPDSPLLPAVLEGLAKFAHLINVDFFADLLDVLKKISTEQYKEYVQGDADASARSAFHCVIAAFQLLSGQGEAINLDLKDFYKSMYTQLLRLPMNPEAAMAVARTVRNAQKRNVSLDKVVHVETRSGSEIELALHGFELLFYRKKQVPAERVAAFVKRLATCALHLPANAVLACLAVVRTLIIRFPRLESLLDAEGRLGTGLYRPLLDDPELCNPFASNLWEMSLFMNHYHPTVRNLARHVSATAATSTTTATSTVSNVHKPLPPHLNLRTTDFLTRFDATPHNESFALTPAAEVPHPIASALKKKKAKGIKYADGPAVHGESVFLQEVEKKVEAIEAGERQVRKSIKKLWMEREAEELRTMVELMHQIQQEDQQSESENDEVTWSSGDSGEVSVDEEDGEEELMWSSGDDEELVWSSGNDEDEDEDESDDDGLAALMEQAEDYEPPVSGKSGKGLKNGWDVKPKGKSNLDGVHRVANGKRRKR